MMRTSRVFGKKSVVDSALKEGDFTQVEGDEDFVRIANPTPASIEEEFIDVGTQQSEFDSEEEFVGIMNSNKPKASAQNDFDGLNSFTTIGDATEPSSPLKPQIQQNVLETQKSVLATEKSESNQTSFEKKRYATSKLALLHIKYFFDKVKAGELKLIGATRSASSANGEGISDGIVFYSFQDVKSGDFVHAFYPACDMKTQKGDVKTTDVIDLNHALAVYKATTGQYPEGKKHRLFIPVATKQKAAVTVPVLNVKVASYNTDHWLTLCCEESSNSAIATLTDSIDREYDTSYIEKSVKTNLGVEKLNHVRKKGHQQNDIDCGSYYLIYSEHSYENKELPKEMDITNEVYAKYENEFNNWCAENASNKRDEGTKVQDQPIPYSSYQKYIVPADSVDQTVALNAVTIQFCENKVVETQTSGENFPREFGSGGITVQGLVSAKKDVQCDWDYVKLYIDEITGGDRELENWIKYNAHAANDTAYAVYSTQALKLALEKLPNLTMHHGENAQVHLYKSADPNDQSVYMYIAHLFNLVSDNDEVDANGKAKVTTISNVATFNMLIKATKTETGIVTTVKYANFTAHHPEVVKAFNQIAAEEKLPTIPTIRNNSSDIVSKQTVNIAKRNLALRQIALADKQLKLERQKKQSEREVAKLEVEIAKKRDQQQELLERITTFQDQIPIGMFNRFKSNLLASEKEINQVLETLTALNTQIRFLKSKGLNENQAVAFLGNPIQFEGEINHLIEIQKELLDLVSKLKGVSPHTLALYQNKPLSYEREIKRACHEDYVVALLEKISKLKIDEKLRDYYLANPEEFADKIEQSLTLQQGLLIKIDVLDNINEEEKKNLREKPLDFEDEINLHYNFLIEKNQLARVLNQLVLSRMDRLFQFIDAMPEAKLEKSRFKLFGTSVDEKKIATEHFNQFSSLRSVVAERLKNRMKALEKIDEKAIQFVLLDILDDVLVAAKCGILAVQKQGSALSRESYVASLMQYTEELEEDLKKLGQTGSPDALSLIERPLPKLNDKLTNRKIVQHFEVIQAEISNLAVKEKVAKM